MSLDGHGASAAVPKDTRLVDDDEILFRQIHPELYLDGTLASSAFQPTVADKGQLSVDRLSLTDAAASFALYVGNGLKSRATYGVSVGQFGAEGISCHSDPLAATAVLQANPAHAYADYTGIASPKAEKKKAQRLRDKVALLSNSGPECWPILAHLPPFNLGSFRFVRRAGSGLERQSGIV